MVSTIADLKMNTENFVELLRSLIGVSEKLQNSPPIGLVPQETLAADLVIANLAPYTVENGGVLEIQKIEFVEGRANLIIKYPGTDADKVVSFVGSHMDVVPAIDDSTSTSPDKKWTHTPFKLTVDGDKLYGRGTTDCLGHVALLTDLFRTLAIEKPALKHTVAAVFIANEEFGGAPGIGVDQLAKENYLDFMKNGPVYWIDAADSQPCIGTCGTAQWSLLAEGLLFHSGLPHKGINAVEMAMDAVNYIQQRFFAEFPAHPKEAEYKFMTQSTFKATKISSPEKSSLNQIPDQCTVQGDIRLSPFYNCADVEARIEAIVAEINANPNILVQENIRGPHSKYVLPEGKAGKLTLTWVANGENGVACNIESYGYKALLTATATVLGEAKPYSIGGSLPLIRSLQEQGFDVQISGYGISARYHADNEYASLNDFQKATQVLSNVISEIEK